ncbi:hypothetical protein DPMN_070039 [Dreissena polymorpha]|uniref:Uncharacterized protein n=1 Tax=Dreissena polymorpha TaxID=45954 RepID=A0A9D4BX46_DREPO|nr:hypothetical protein DPMN_070039 [Dreissena polymorpha]
MGHLSTPPDLLGGHLSAPLKLGGTSPWSTSRRARLSGYQKSAHYLKALLKNLRKTVIIEKIPNKCRSCRRL